MSIWTLLFLLAFVAMIAMHLRGGGHGGCGGGHGHGHDDHRHDEALGPDATAPDVRPSEDPRPPGEDGHGTRDTDRAAKRSVAEPTEPASAVGGHTEHAPA